MVGYGDDSITRLIIVSLNIRAVVIRKRCRAVIRLKKLGSSGEQWQDQRHEGTDDTSGFKAGCHDAVFTSPSHTAMSR